MCNFNNLSEETKGFIHLFMTKGADSIGGTNFLLGLMEAMKEKKPNALMFNGCDIKSNEAGIRWNKIVFKDKLDILEEIIRSRKSNEENNFNILDVDSDKKRKKILNMVKTLAPIEFTITPINSENGAGFNFKVFDSVDDSSAKLNPIFVAMFFCSTEFMKKALKFNMSS